MTTGTSSLFDIISPTADSPRRIVFPDGADPRVVEAACRAQRLRLAQPILLGEVAEIRATLAEAGLGGEGLEIIDPQCSEQFDEYAIEFAEQRQIPLHTARCMTTVPFYFATLMLACGDAEAMIAGASCSSQEILMASELAIGTRPGTTTASSFAILEVPGFRGTQDAMLVLADPVVNPEPTAEQLADIALATADSCEAVLGWQARVALLSHSTHSHPLEPRAEHVCKAVDILRRRAPGLRVDGELQVDAALDPSVADKKLDGAAGVDGVAGRANVLIFPDLNAGNIALKMAQQLAMATVAGPVLQGFEYPVGLVSRAANPRDILATIALTAGYTDARARPQPRLVNPLEVDFHTGRPNQPPSVFV